jgi:hypothetical protein
MESENFSFDQFDEIIKNNPFPEDFAHMHKLSEKRDVESIDDKFFDNEEDLESDDLSFI